MLKKSKAGDIYYEHIITFEALSASTSHNYGIITCIAISKMAPKYKKVKLRMLQT